ncbi:MAG: hypothetical protein Kow0042_05990 [Calditrichia bacterium]
MKRFVLVFLILTLLMVFFTRLKFDGEARPMAESMMALGFTLIVGYLLGLQALRLQLPKITGYILSGFLFGPYFFNLLSKSVVTDLQLIDHIALSLIALTAGGEFRYRVIKKQFRTIGSAIFWQIVIVMLGFILFILFYRNHISFLSNQSLNVALGVGILFGSLSIAKSPATTIAVITETRARGKFTDFVLGVTVFKDIIVVLIFSIALSFSRPLILSNESLHYGYISSVFLEVLYSLFAGVGVGAVIVLYLKYVRIQTTLFLLGLILLGIEFSSLLHLEVILIFIVAGFVVQNFSDKGAGLIEAIEAGSLPVYVIFFAIAGASLNLPVFLSNWSLALLIVGLRLLTTFQGTYLGGKLTGAGREIQHFGWMGFIGQAGLTLGLAMLVRQNLPGTIGINISTLIIASVAINQIIGPVLFRYSLVKVGDVR